MKKVALVLVIATIFASCTSGSNGDVNSKDSTSVNTPDSVDVTLIIPEVDSVNTDSIK